MQPLIIKKIAQPEQLGYVSHVKGIMFLTDSNYMPPSWHSLTTGSSVKLPQMDLTCTLYLAGIPEDVDCHL